MIRTHTYAVPDVSCQHCVDAIEGQVGGLAGVQSVKVDLETKTVVVVGGDDEAIVTAIDNAGYDVVDAESQ